MKCYIALVSEAKRRSEDRSDIFFCGKTNTVARLEIREIFYCFRSAELFSLHILRRELTLRIL